MARPFFAVSHICHEIVSGRYNCEEVELMAYRLHPKTLSQLTRLVEYERHRVALRHRPKGPSVRGLSLLRSLLTPDQRTQLANTGRFRVSGSEGGTYRLEPRFKRVERVDFHGRKWYVDRVYCFHVGWGLPGADHSIGAMMLIMTDESAFLAEANETNWHRTLWDGEYLRGIQRARRERRAFARAAEQCALLAPAIGARVLMAASKASGWGFTFQIDEQVA